MKWAAEFSVGTMRLGALGTSNVGYEATVEGDTEAAARAAAQEKLVEFNGGKGTLRKLTPLHTYAVTFRGVRDKRRRETFYVTARDEDAAVRALRHNPSACRFAGYGTKQRERLVRVEVQA